jgi:hypothetical protein
LGAEEICRAGRDDEDEPLEAGSGDTDDGNEDDDDDEDDGDNADSGASELERVVIDDTGAGTAGRTDDIDDGWEAAPPV